MKKILLTVYTCIFILALSTAQNEGYKWIFASTPFNSLPAVAGSLGNYTLTTIGSGSITAGVSDNVGLGASCTGNINVGNFTKPFGLNFSNNPQFAGNTYSIEIVFKFSEVNGFRRLLNFYTLPSDFGVYLAGGGINFYEGFNVGTTVTGNIIPVNTWVQLDFVRDGVTKIISCYKDGALVGTFADINDNFIPHAAAQNEILFFKDNTDISEESSGSVAKIQVYNYTLSSTDVVQNFNTICNSSVLSVTFLSFSAGRTGSAVLLNWSTASEINNKGFEIERSTDGINYMPIDFINANNNYSAGHQYSYTDKHPFTVNYYQLKQIDINGQSKYSPVKVVKLNDNIISLFPNPTNDVVAVSGLASGDEIRITTIESKLISMQLAKANTETIDMAKQASGIYFLTIMRKSVMVETIKLVKK